MPCRRWPKKAMRVAAVPPPKPTYTQIFGQWLCDQAAADERLVADHARHARGQRVGGFGARNFPSAISMWALPSSTPSLLPAVWPAKAPSRWWRFIPLFCSAAMINWCTMWRCKPAGALLPWIRAGIVGADGPTHAGVYDLSFLRCLPIWWWLRRAMSRNAACCFPPAISSMRLSAVRYPRGSGKGAKVSDGLETVPVGKGVLRRQGRRTAILAFGGMVQPALAAAEELNATWPICAL